MKVLFLEDDEARIVIARREFVGCSLRIARTAAEAIALLQDERFDLVSLDHDLGGKVMVASDADSGYAVAEWIAESEDWQAPVIVHSMNPVGGAKMVDVLWHVGCIRTVFNTPGYWRMVKLVRGN